jgi:excinuclease ABC subunit B
MKNAIDETRRRRRVQEDYNRQHGITPETIRKNIRAGIEAEVEAHRQANAAVGRTSDTEYVTQEYINELEAEMLAAAEALEFERAAALRDRIVQLQESYGEKISDVQVKSYSPQRGRYRGRKGKAKIPKPKKGL